MTKAMKRMLLILVLATAFVICGVMMSTSRIGNGTMAVRVIRRSRAVASTH